MPDGRGVAPLADVADRQRRDGFPESVIRREHSVIPMPVLPRRRHEICEPVTCAGFALIDPARVARLNAVRIENRGFAAPMLENMMARMLLRAGYRSRSLTTNERQFRAAARAIEELVATTPEPVLRGRRPVAPLPGVTSVMQGWSAFMTIDHVNGVHEAMLELIPQLEAGRQPDIGDISRFDHPGDCGPEVMPRFRDLVARVASLPESHAFNGRGTFLHPIFGRLNSRGAYALLALHLRLHVPHVRRSIEVNGRP